MDAHLDEKSSLLHNNSAILEEDENEGDEEDYEEEGYKNNGCGCIRLFCVGRKRRRNRKSHLWRRKLKEVKVITELLCGPKWKNLIRKLSVFVNNINRNKRKRVPQFQYDPQTYALNFDHGIEDDASHLDFISRLPPPSNINSG
ncbi:hypothetical protein NE237_026836 [Protea cynaroides]|uniref:Uncharacterized protein n=1 Tax=Protea cynaroides TaxID=273540 RepID=A0A9Q0GQP2_9MAGN|nr:hypothetical protein NE237_026836 [Protea cynaroides]